MQSKNDSTLPSSDIKQPDIDKDLPSLNELELYPPVLQQVIMEHLTVHEQDALVEELTAANRKLPSFFQRLLDYRPFVDAQYEQVRNKLPKNIDFIIKKGNFEDYSKRVFKDISAFEYALWALDEHMWTTMLDCLGQEQDNQIRIRILNKMVEQYRKVKEERITYTLNGTIITEKHYDFAIIQALQTQVDLQAAEGDKNLDAIDKQWCQGVGGAQKRLPMHVIHEYCADEVWDSTAMFISRPQKLLRTFWNLLTNGFKDWFSPDSKLGQDFAIVKGPLGGSAGYARAVHGRARGLLRDLDAMRALCEARTTGFAKLESRLSELLAAENQLANPQV